MKANLRASCLLSFNCLIVLCLIVLPKAALADTYTTLSGQFFSIIKANFNQWDRGHDGTVTSEDIDIAMQNPLIRGDDAAALAALKLGEHSISHEGKPTIAYTVSAIDNLERQVKLGARLHPDYIHYFDWGRRKLASQSRQLFAQGIPHLISIRQDKTSDCYLLSAVGALANANPQAIVNMIEQNADRSYKVQLPGQNPQRVTAPTDAEIAAYSDAGKDGIWLNVLEKACAQTNFTHREAIEPMDVVAASGGFSGEAIELITGHKVIAMRFHWLLSFLDFDLKNRLRSSLNMAFKQHKLVTTGKMDHLYALIAYDPIKDTVTLWNPQARSGLEKWSDGTTGPKMENGIFAVSVDDFVNNFVGILLEQ